MEITPEQVELLNAKIPHNYLWDGFWIESFKRKTLNISAAFDKIYSRDFMIVYKGVTFFNLPLWWRDTWIKLPFMQLTTGEEFLTQFPNENIRNKSIIKWQLIGFGKENEIENFYIVCDKIFVFKCNGEERKYDMTYEEPLPNKEYKDKRFFNRIPLLKSNDL
jgi:hypothetical protein